MALIGYGAFAALGGALIYANLPTRLTIGAVAPTASYLAKAKLVPVRGNPEEPEKIDKSEEIEASKIFEKGPTMVMAVRRPGCLLCRKEAKELSTLQPEMEKNGIRLIAVVHEKRGVNAFKPYFKGDVYFDEDKHFYGPNQRWLPIWMGVLRFGTYLNVWNSKKAGFDGNLHGEGRLLGGVYLIADGELQYAHLEKEWGDAANIDEVTQAIHKFGKKGN
ncbi:unnamed protein product [Caenorhabditis auriculariae]|uniref:Peroxiredoxin-like 2A n=1 Tax=Caenorhabditis auriculariae TaxID=2777116 RepID=A0A8S1HD34_9PELO|nr:unnamed protein product [Caenorhabditis auriculariae]